MNILSQLNHSVTSMTSLDISMLVNSELRAVNLSIERLASRGVIQLSSMVKVENKQSLSPNKMVGVYVFTGEQGKLDSITIVAQLCPEFTAAIVKRWYELENQQRFNVPQTLSEALQLAADQAKQLELAAPKVEFYDKLADRKTLLNATQVAQKLGMSAVAMNKILDRLNVYSTAVKRSRVFKQWFIDNGFGELKETELGFSQALFTTTGEQWVFEKLSSEGVI